MKKTPAHRRELAAAALIIALGVARICLLLLSSLKANGGPGFPLDDPWIHLQFARNLREFGAFSYFRNEMVTAGSTSPLYTILLSLGFFFTSDEMLLSYVMGITFFARSRRQASAASPSALAQTWVATAAENTRRPPWAAMATPV